MSRFTILETSIDADNYVNLVLIDTFDNVHQITIRTCDLTDPVNIVERDDPENAFDFRVDILDLECYLALKT